MDTYSIKSKRKSNILGMNISTANYRLMRSVLFWLLQSHNKNICYRCGKKIRTLCELSIDHKIDWMYSVTPKLLYFSLDNIAFSHTKCNISAGHGGQIKALHYRKSKEEQLETARRYHRTNKYRTWRRAYEKRRYHNDPKYRAYYLNKSKRNASVT